MKRTKTLLLPTTLTMAAILLGLGACGAEPPVPRPIDVTFETGQVHAPGATIIVNGEENSEQAVVGENALVGIVKDGKAYLYHPALGPAELSDYNSRRAVGFFITQSLGETPQGKLIRDRSTWLAVGESTEASTGITVERVGDATYKVTNNKRRWAAVKSGATGEPRFLLPRKSLIETNLIQLMAELVSGNSSASASVQISVDEADVETFGAVVRANSLLWVPVLGGQLVQKAETALNQDTTLFLRLNALDYMSVTIGGAKSIAGLFPFECADAVINGAVLNAFETLGVGLLTGDEALTKEFASAMAADMAQSTAGCVCFVSTAGACEALTSFLDMMAAVNWVIDDQIVGPWDVITNDAYATVEGIEAPPPPPNKPPVAQGQTVSAAYNTPKGVTLVATDPDGGPQPLTYNIVSQASHGTLSGALPNLTYTPASGYSGPDSFTFQANDGDADSNVATVLIGVGVPANQPPVAQDQTVNVAYNTPKGIILVATDPDGGPQPLTYGIVTQPSQGTLSGSPPNVTYTPNSGFTSQDSFTFNANDGDADSNAATISITVQPGGEGLFAAAVHYPAGNGPWSVAIGDLNGDQVPDLAVANRGTYPGFAADRVSVLLGVGDGTFAGAVHYAAGNRPTSVAIGDLNGDQVPDLAVANRGTYPSFDDGRVWVLLGVGDGTFAEAVNYPAGDEPRSVAIGDLDGDQVPDLAVANLGHIPYHGSVSVLLGRGDGTFAAAVNYDAGRGSQSIAIGDLDGDLAPDLTVANFYSDNVSVLLGVGDGTFTAAVHYAAGDYAVSVAISDLDGDQVPDLAVANAESGNVSVLLGVGDGTFAAAAHYAAGGGPWSIAVGDLDGDQVPDVAVAGIRTGSAYVSVLLGVGDGTFTGAVHYSAGDEPRSVAIEDLDGDHVPDLAVANNRSDNVSVLLGIGD